MVLDKILQIIIIFFVFSLFINETAKADNKYNIPAAIIEDNNKIVIDVSSPIKLSESTVSGTLIAAYSIDDHLLFSAGFPLTWNTFSANALGELHLFVRTPNMEAPFVALPRTVKGAHTAYVVRSGKRIFFLDESNNRIFQIKTSQKGKNIIANEPVIVSPEPFKNLGYKYTVENVDSNKTLLSACKLTDPTRCEKISIYPRSVVFGYGGNDSNTVAVTNKGDVLFHNKNGWCRGEEAGEGYKCNSDAVQYVDHRGWQIYSSIKTREGTLLGEYPTGRFWKLSDGTLEPTSLSPYSGNKHKNLELQSVSLFCGDLYVGLWPRGEVWEKTLESKNWRKLYSLYSHPSYTLNGFIPYRFLMLMSRGYKLSAFLGQRATSMANDQNSLFVTAGNYGGWNNNIPDPWFLTKEQIDEYGLVHSKTESNCLTTYLNDQLRLKIILKSDRLIVYDNGNKVAETKLHDFNINKIDHFKIGEGVFGTLSDKKVCVKIE
jgi:hypothetical protein